MYQATGLCPVPGDCHLAEYLPWCHDPKARPWEKYDLFLYDWDRAQVERDKMWQSIGALAHGGAPLDGLREAHGEGAAELIEGLLGTEDMFRPAVNIPNKGDIPNLPDGAIVEVPALVGNGNIRGVNTEPLPTIVAELCRREIAVASLAVDAAVTEAIVAMAHSLRLRVVAEGVETLEQAEFLLELGCDELQGYLFSAAVPAEDFTRFLEPRKRE